MRDVLDGIGRRLEVRLATSLSGQRELRVHGRREVVIIKPSARRHWMGVSALEDADAVIVESFSGATRMKLPRDVPVTAGRPFIELAPEISTAILRTVEAGWALALKWPDVNAGAAEVPMTERLRDGMRSALNGGELPWGRTMVVLPGTESRSRPDVLRPDGRTDIPILLIRTFLRFGEHDPHADHRMQAHRRR